MKVTDDSDKIKLDYDPLIPEHEIDITAPYIDFSYMEELAEVTVPESGVYDTLFYNDTKILIVNEVAEVEIRFYSTENPNEKYRTGQKHFKGRIINISQTIQDVTDNAGFKISVDMSQNYNAKVQDIVINKKYVEITKTRCIAILYFDEKGNIIDELVIPIKDWFSSKVYLNSAFVVEEDPKVPYKVGDIVDIEYYKLLERDSEGNPAKVELLKDTGRITDLKLTFKEFEYKDQGKIYSEEIQYFIIYLDASTLYNKKLLTIANNVVKSMKVHVIVPEL